MAGPIRDPKSGRFIGSGAQSSAAGYDVVSIGLDDRSRKVLQDFVARAQESNVFRFVGNFLEREGARLAFKISQLVTAGRLGLHRRDGTLARSIVGVGVTYEGAPAFRVGVLSGPALKYAGVQEYGTKGKNPASPYDTIRPRRAKALAMPGPAALTPAGRLKEAFGGGPRARDDLKFVPFRRSTVAIGALYTREELERVRDSAGATNFRDAKAAYILLRQTDLPAHHYLRRPTLAEVPHIAARLADALGGMLDGSGPTVGAPA